MKGRITESDFNLHSSTNITNQSTRKGVRQEIIQGDDSYMAESFALKPFRFIPQHLQLYPVRAD